MWGIIPAAGTGSRIQPLGFSKELLPVGVSLEQGRERPRAVSEYLVERLIIGGATRICFVVSPGKSDIMQYFGGKIGSVDLCYAVQPQPTGLCDAIFRAIRFIHRDEVVMIGLPDTIWFPKDGFSRLNDDGPSLLLFPVDRPERFDSVITDRNQLVKEVQVKKAAPDSVWIWGAMKLPSAVLHALFNLWVQRGQCDEQIGSLINAYVSAGGTIEGIRAGQSYVDVGTVDGYREALLMLERKTLLAEPL